MCCVVKIKQKAKRLFDEFSYSFSTYHEIYPEGLQLNKEN